MTKTQLAGILRVELNWLNRIIDQKIIRGQSYQTEARRHKALLAKLAQI